MKNMKLTDIITDSTIRNCVSSYPDVQTAEYADCDLDTIRDKDGIEIYNLIRDGKVVGSIEDNGQGFEFSTEDGKNSASME